MHVVHAIHDFPPRHQAGSEIYALELARAQSVRHHVTILCAEYDPSRDHGHVEWRVYQGLPVVEIINNWRCESFSETYRPPLITERIRQILTTLEPDVVHVHNLLNLSFDLPVIARELGIPTVATLHDYTLVCASGGQRVHKRDRHVCHEIDTARCARCYSESPFHAQTALGKLAPAGTMSKIVGRAAAAARRIAPGLVTKAAQAARHVGSSAIRAEDIDQRMAAAKRVFDDVDLFVAPSPSIAREFTRLGLAEQRIKVSDYGMVPFRGRPRPPASLPLRIGFVGTLVWHKGAHVLLDAVRQLPAAAYTLRLFGNANTFPDYTADLRKQAAGLPIEFAGAFAPSDAKQIYDQIDVLVVPSLWPENSPLVIHEAFMAGVAVVGARMGGIADLVTDGKDGLLYDATSPADLALKLTSLIREPERATELGASAPAVKSIAQDADEWDAVYAGVMSRSRVPA